MKPISSSTESVDHEIERAGSIPEAFQARVYLTPNATAYRHHQDGKWLDTSWREVADRVTIRRAAFRSAGLERGDRVGIFMPNCVDWVVTDLAAMSEGLVSVPLYVRDSAQNIRHVLRDSGAALCVTDTSRRWESLEDASSAPLDALKAVWVLGQFEKATDPRVLAHREVLEQDPQHLPNASLDADDLATIVYTSGTTGPPKGVMLSHGALLWNARSVLAVNPVTQEDVFLSILPLAHGFERSIGWLCPLLGGATVTYSRSIELLARDLTAVSPTVMLAVPRLFEKIHSRAMREAGRSPYKEWLLRKTEDVGWTRRCAAEGLVPAPGIQESLFWRLIGRRIAGKVRAAFGHRIRIILSGGAPLPEDTGRFMAAMEMPLIEGYGLTEAGPAATGSTLEDRRLGSVGRALPGAELRIAAQDELQIRSPGVMQGYWNNPQATADAIDGDGWLQTGDAASIVDGRVFIRGRIKDVIVLSTGENVNPSPLEEAILSDPIIEQACVVGDGRSRCLAVVVVDQTKFSEWKTEMGYEKESADSSSVSRSLRSRLLQRMDDIPPFARIAGVFIETKPWMPDSGLITPTLKTKRKKIADHYQTSLDAA